MYYRNNNDCTGRYSEDVCQNNNYCNMPYDNMIYDCNKNMCCYNKCDEIIRQAHVKFKEANSIYDNIDNLLSDKIINQIMDVICSLENYIICNKKANKLYEDGINLIETNDCGPKCIEIECCNYLADASEFYGYKDKTIDTLRFLLNKALEEAKDAVKVNDKENTAFNKYISCIHKDCNN